MIFGNENISAYSRSNMCIWMILAFQAGLLNVGGFLSSKTFVSHVTGFATLASVELEEGRIIHFLGLASMPLAFLLGAMTSGILVDLRIKLHKKPKYYFVFGFIFLITLLIAIGGFNNLFGEFGQFPTAMNGYVLVLLLCYICGVQNGTITLVSKSIVRTTHLTGITTDLGIGLIRILNRHRIKDIENEGIANLMRLGIISCFIVGSIVGVPLFLKMKFRGFWLPCFISAGLFFITFYFQVMRKQKN